MLNIHYINININISITLHTCTKDLKIINKHLSVKTKGGKYWGNYKKWPLTGAFEFQGNFLQPMS